MISDQPPVVITLSTIPTRIDAIEPCLCSLLDQDYPEFRVVLNLPEICLRDGEVYRQPPWMSRLLDDQSHFQTRRVDEDYGPITKLVPTLQAGWNSLVAVCDDDHVYGPHWLATLVSAQRALSSSAVVGFSGIVTGERGGLLKYVRVSSPQPVLFTQGYTGYLFDVSVLGGADLLDAAKRIWKIDPLARFVDDVVVGAFFDELGMPRFAVPQPKMATNDSLNLGDALHDDDMNYARAYGPSRHQRVLRKLCNHGFFSNR